jgi:AcrR family transcriptional regulator
MSGEARRRRIIKVAARLFAEHGFHAATTREIAHGAGISEAGLFQHFQTKADLYAAILDEKARQVYDGEWVERLRKLAARNDDEGLFRAVAARICEYCRSDPDFLRLMLHSALEKHESAQAIRERLMRPVFELLRDYIERRQREGYFRECDAEAAAFAFMGTQVYFAIVRYLFNSRLFTVAEEEAVATFVNLSLDGLRKAPGRAQNKKSSAGRKSKDLQI